MDTFDNFQYDSASSYGGMGIVDDTSSVYTANTVDQDQDQESVDLSNLSISEYNGGGPHGHGAAHAHHAGINEDFDSVLDDLKDGGAAGAVDLPPHACRCVYHNFVH